MLIHLLPELVFATAIMSLLLIWRHKGNIENLMAGKESKIGSKKSDTQSA
jgi:acyl phosphate:glycerol-3-phosphate acyltransferase